MTIYVPDDLAAELKQVEDINVSAICQTALRSELERRAAMKDLDDGMERHELYVRNRGGNVAFTGKHLVTGEHGTTVEVYLTQRHRIALYDETRQELYTFDNYQQFAKALPGRPEVTMLVAQALGEKYVTELDI